MSDEIIKVLDYLGQKFGIAIGITKPPYNARTTEKEKITLYFSEDIK